MIELPSWDECYCKADSGGALTAVEYFVFMNQTASRNEFRKELQAALNEAYKRGEQVGIYKMTQQAQIDRGIFG